MKRPAAKQSVEIEPGSGAEEEQPEAAKRKAEELEDFEEVSKVEEEREAPETDAVEAKEKKKKRAGRTDEEKAVLAAIPKLDKYRVLQFAIHGGMRLLWHS